MDEIRTLREEDIAQSVAMSQFAFQYEIAQSELAQAYEDVVPDEIYAYYVDRKLAAKLHLLPLTVYAGGVPFKMGGVAGVATWPEYRRGGKVAKLLQHALAVMKENGQTVSMLAPFSFAFYRRYGWEHCIDRKQYTLQRADWPTFDATEGYVERVEDISELSDLYEAFAAHYSGMLRRTSEWWGRKVKRWGSSMRAVYRTKDGASAGYIVYQVKNAVMTVHELVYVTQEARRGLWNFIRNHDSMADKVTLIAPTDDPLPFLIPNPRITQEVIPYFMARVVDVEGFLAQYPFVASSGQSRLYVRISDKHAPWNEGTFLVESSPEFEGSARVQRLKSEGRSGSSSLDGIDAGRGDGLAIDDDEAKQSALSMDDLAWGDTASRKEETEQSTLSMDIQTLTAALFGYQRPRVLAKVGRISGSTDAVQTFERLIPVQTPFLYDFF